MHRVTSERRYFQHPANYLGLEQTDEGFFVGFHLVFVKVEHVIEHPAQVLIEGCGIGGDGYRVGEVFEEGRKLTAAETRLLETLACLARRSKQALSLP